jgi:hypothetical protein
LFGRMSCLLHGLSVFLDRKSLSFNLDPFSGAHAIIFTSYKAQKALEKSAKLNFASKTLELRLRQLTEFYAPLKTHLEKKQSPIRKTLADA